jgi:catechol 2,3-dioxygenase-like lactoylglutathione lyase family enzyme
MAQDENPTNISVFFGVSHVDIPVRDLRRSEHLYVGALGFTKNKTGTGWLDIESGTVRLRLVESESPKHRVAIRVQTRDVALAYKTLLEHGLTGLYEPMRTPDQELVAAVVDADGNTLSLWRDLTEDEYDVEPELPKQLVWADEASALLQSMLKSVPVMFRALARRKITRNAEWYAQGTQRVVIDHVVRAFIISNAKFTRDRVRKPLLAHGFNPDDYRDEFEA